MTGSPHPKHMYTIARLFRAAAWLVSSDPARRRRIKLELARLSAGLFGDHYLGSDCKRWRSDIEFKRNFRRLSPHNPYSEERKFALREFVRLTRHLPGALAECGSYTGVSAFFMAAEAPDTEFFLFDSFEGLSQPGPQDKAPGGMQNWQSGDLKTPETIIQANLAGFRNIHILKGWIPERFNEVGERQFRVVHIDVDLYRPTLDSLVFFYPRMVDGGVIVMDDYGFLNCPGVFQAAGEYMDGKPEHILHLPTGQGVIIRNQTPH